MADSPTPLSASRWAANGSAALSIGASIFGAPAIGLETAVHVSTAMDWLHPRASWSLPGSVVAILIMRWDDVSFNQRAVVPQNEICVSRLVGSLSRISQ
jgi:hypothetical protein